MQHTELFVSAEAAVHAAGNYRPYSYRVMDAAGNWSQWEVSDGCIAGDGKTWSGGTLRRTYAETSAVEFRTREAKGRETYMFAVKTD